MSCEKLKLSAITFTAGTQVRAKIDDGTVAEYSDAMLDAANNFPPVVVFHNGSQYILADGFHRIMAATHNGFLDIEADVHKGTRSDALRWALGANVAHGLRRSNSDKRRSVELALAEWPKLSDREIARVCAVSDHFAGDIRKANCELNAVEQPRIGADGKTRRQPAKRTVLSEPEVERPCVHAGPVKEEKSELEPTPPPAPQPQEFRPRLKTNMQFRGWWCRASKATRAEFLPYLFGTQVVVADKADVRKRMGWWLDHCVTEAKL